MSVTMKVEKQLIDQSDGYLEVGSMLNLASQVYVVIDMADFNS